MNERHERGRFPLAAGVVASTLVCVVPDPDTCYRAMQSRDARFDGWFFVAVSSTGIYCRPSCPAKTPRRENVGFYATAAAAQAAGYRACLRCRPDAAPGSPEWNLQAGVAGRAMRLIADGLVDREGVDGLARRLAYSARHLRRLLTDELGAGPLELARAQRAQTARLLIETTSLPFGDVAFAAGFSSLRQFNDTVRSVFALTPTELRSRRRSGPVVERLGIVSLRLPHRTPFHAAGLLEFLAERAVPGVEEVDGERYRRTLLLPHGVGVAELTPRAGFVDCTLRLADLRDLAAAVSRCRAAFDLDADPAAVDAALAQDVLLAPLVSSAPGLRVPGTVDGAELALRAVLGQQISVRAARRIAGRLAEAVGEPLAQSHGSLRRTFPSAAAVAAADPNVLPMPAARRRTLQRLAAALAEGRITPDAGADRDEVRRRLLEIPGIGAWTASYILMRAVADTDAFPAGDHGVRQALGRLDRPVGAARAVELAEPWRPWRAYAVQHLWATAPGT
jgi:AraC family transcriptional regulator, regulatory protein of adaptative response / DNA-3-methyladenine glycosylase II